jgi:hypothetical protein
MCMETRPLKALKTCASSPFHHVLFLVQAKKAILRVSQLQARNITVHGRVYGHGGHGGKMQLC